MTQAEIDAATRENPQLHNLVTADSDESDETTDENDIPIDYTPALELTKNGAWADGDADGYADPGEAINHG